MEIFTTDEYKMEALTVAKDRTESIDKRLPGIRQLGTYPQEESLATLLTLINDFSEEPDIRVHAIRAFSWLDKRSTYGHMIALLEDQNPEIVRQALESIPECKDSRYLFALFNLYNRLNLSVDQDRVRAYGILQTIEWIKDPRGAEFLERIASGGDKELAAKARNAYLECADNSEITYTFHGAESDRKKAEVAQGGIAIKDRAAWNSKGVKEIFDAEPQGDLKIAIYTVVPNTPQNPFGEKTLLIAPRRSEHYVCAKGRDVLAAGELGVNNAHEIKYVDPHSGGFYPGRTSFVHVKEAAKKANLPFELEGFSALYPAEGYCTGYFLAQHPLARTSDKK